MKKANVLILLLALFLSVALMASACDEDEDTDGDDGDGDGGSESDEIFDGYDCNDSADFCSAAMCGLKDAYVQMEQACKAANYCDALLGCLMDLKECIDTNCDKDDYTTANNITACTTDYGTCSQNAIVGAAY